MSNFDDIDFDSPRQKPAPTLQVWDILSIGVLLITLCMGLYFVLVFMNPQLTINPFSPQRLSARLIPTPTITPISMPATWTPTATPYIPPTDTPLPTFTPVFTQTQVLLVPPTATLKPSSTPRPSATPKAPFSVKVEYIASSKYRPEFGCNWQGIAGIALDKGNAHFIYQIVHLVGDWNGQSFNQFLVTGGAPQIYGPSGFEYQLGTTPVNSTKSLQLQLRDQGGLPLSEIVYLNTYSDCSRNMAFITFRENK